MVRLYNSLSTKVYFTAYLRTFMSMLLLGFLMYLAMTHLQSLLIAPLPTADSLSHACSIFSSCDLDFSPFFHHQECASLRLTHHYYFDPSSQPTMLAFSLPMYSLSHFLLWSTHFLECPVTPSPYFLMVNCKTQPI
jgi:hypothetical protein